MSSPSAFTDILPGTNADNYIGRLEKKLGDSMYKICETRLHMATFLCVALTLAGCSGSTSSGSTTSAPLTLQGTPPTSVTAGNAYSFQPTATAGNAVSFFIRHKPAWARFDTATGALSGTPTETSVGATANITIFASDGTNTASVGPFAIVVNARSANSPGSATLSWLVPTENTNGTPLTDLAGYHIRYGTNPADLTQVIELPDTQATMYEIGGLSPGTYYFAITAYTAMGTESAESDVGYKVI